MGLSLSDPESVQASSRVLLSSVLLSLTFIATTVIEMLAGNSIGVALIGLASSLSAPAFGILGSRRGSATLMSLFVALMLVNTGISVLFVLALITTGPNRRWGNLLVGYTVLWAIGGALSAWAGVHGSKLLKKLQQGEKIVEDGKAVDPESFETDIDAELPTFDVSRKRIFIDSKASKEGTELGMRE